MELPPIESRRTTTTLPDYGDEPTIVGHFEGTADQFIDYMREQGVVVVLPAIPDDSDGEPFILRARFDEVPAGVGLRQIADQLPDNPSVLRRSHSIYLIGEPDDQDFVSRVFFVPGESAGDYLEAVGALTTDNAAIAAVGDVLVVRDTYEGIQDISALFDTIGAARGQWQVDVQFVELSSVAAEAVGLDWDITGDAELVFGTDTSSLEIAARIASLLSYDQTNTHAQILTTTRLHVVEGQNAELQIGETTPIFRRAVSDAGTVTTTDVEFIDTGVIVNLGVRSEPDGRLRVILTPEISQVIGFVDDAPIRSRRRIQTAAVIDPGGTLIVGGFTQQAERTTQEGIPGMLDQVLARVQSLDDDHTRVYIILSINTITAP